CSRAARPRRASCAFFNKLSTIIGGGRGSRGGEIAHHFAPRRQHGRECRVPARGHFGDGEQRHVRGKFLGIVFAREPIEHRGQLHVRQHRVRGAGHTQHVITAGGGAHV